MRNLGEDIGGFVGVAKGPLILACRLPLAADILTSNF